MPVSQLITNDFKTNNVLSDDFNNIYRYLFAISFTKISSLESAQIKRAIADLCVKELVLKLQSLNLFGFDKIEVGKIEDSPDPVIITYVDDIYDFSINVGSDIFGFQNILQLYKTF
ncbi:MAG: hypothetical protein JW866_06245 [Ignavibacteriales bacterium]|nr:hypothetical protein [Ignavibacteriales bacterium]